MIKNLDVYDVIQLGMFVSLALYLFLGGIIPVADSENAKMIVAAFLGALGNNSIKNIKDKMKEGALNE